MKNKVFRIIDANLNRLKEGVRVCEDIVRYFFEKKDLALKLKEIRHFVKNEIEFLKYRDIKNDPLKNSDFLKLSSIEKILFANFKRSEEASRVLEEVFKTIDIEKSKIFKEVRYKLYNIEKEVYEAINFTN